MIRFIAEHKDHQVPAPDGGVGLAWGVEPMCAVLSEHGIKISPSTYYEWINKKLTTRQLPDEQVTELIRAEREHPKHGRFVPTLGSRKMWIRLRGKGHEVALLHDRVALPTQRLGRRSLRLEAQDHPPRPDP